VNLLAFDTSTELLRIGVRRGDATPWLHEGPGGAQASATLIPAIQGLLREAGLSLAALDAIVFGSGPGSFTGLRTACSVAQGLAMGAGRPVLAVETLMAVAEDARQRTGARQVVALLDARMDEVYAGAYQWLEGRWHRDGPLRLMSPDEVTVPAGWTLAGSAFQAYGPRLPQQGTRVEAFPTAQALLGLAPALLAQGAGGPADAALPIYIRDKVAHTTEERAALRAAKESA
jgi:tRNA threonylcarbamoyladenosine biosynthesis protein TsaB